MNPVSRAATAAVLVAGLAGPAWAGQVRLEIRDGLVTLDAKDASVREILAEWSRVGQTKITNAERVGGGPVTLQLQAVPEAKVLDILLRSVAGYMAAPRTAAVAAGSRFDRILIMAQPRPAAGVASPAAATSSSTTPSVFDRRGRGTYQPQPSLMVDDQDEPVQPQPQPQPMMPPPNQVIGAGQPGMATPMPQGQMYYPAPQQQQQQPGAAPASPAAARPGMITAPPKPPGSSGPGGN